MNRFCSFLIIVVMPAFVYVGCKPNTITNRDDLVEKVFVVNLVADSLKLQAYLDYHKKVWPEVEAGFKKAGFKKITLYRYDHLLVMTIMVPKMADLGAMGKLAESHSPRCAEWNKLMSGYQIGVPGTSPGQTWVEALPFYRFSNQ